MDASRSHQYLKAMGITAWASRDAEVAVASDPPTSVQSKAMLPVACDLSAGDYISALCSAPIELVQFGAGRLLLITEPPVLVGDDNQLLVKMLGAIGLDFAAQNIARLSEGGATNTTSLVEKLQPDLLLVMAVCRGSATLLDPHRADHHVLPGTTVSLAITLHPTELTQQAELKRPAWEDLKRVKAVLDG